MSLKVNVVAWWKEEETQIWFYRVTVPLLVLVLLFAFLLSIPAVDQSETLHSWIAFLVVVAVAMLVVVGLPLHFTIYFEDEWQRRLDAWRKKLLSVGVVGETLYSLYNGYDYLKPDTHAEHILQESGAKSAIGKKMAMAYKKRLTSLLEQSYSARMSYRICKLLHEVAEEVIARQTPEAQS